jgi:hypothetical protein
MSYRVSIAFGDVLRPAVDELQRTTICGRSQRGGEKSGSNEKAQGSRQESCKDSEIESGWQEGGKNSEAEGSR